MEVHAHTHTPRKKWTHYFWEFLMLFLAVFCGFLAEYQLEHKIEKHRAKEYALSLYRDLTADTLAFNQTISNLNICTRNIDTLITLLGKKEELPKNTKNIYRLSIYAFIFPQNRPNESTLQQLLNSGSLRYFRSNELIDTIKNYVTEIQLFKEFRDDIGSMNIEFRKVQARVLEINPLINATSYNGFLNRQNVLYDSLDFTEQTQLVTSDTLLIKEYANWCALKKFYMANTSAKIYRLKLRAIGVLQVLKDEYHF